MIVIHGKSDDHVFAGWTYFSAWRESRNHLLLLDALSSVQAAEREWFIAGLGDKPMRRDWQVLRRCITRGLVRLREPLFAATTPAQTQKALYQGGKRPQLARVDQLRRRAIRVALVGSGGRSVNVDVAMRTLNAWGIRRKRGYLIKFASQSGLTRRHAPRALVAPIASDTWTFIAQAIRPK